MNVLLLTTSYPITPDGYGGAFIHSLACALARRGHSLRVVVPARRDAIGPVCLDGIPVHAFRYALARGGHLLTGLDGGIPEALRRSRRAALQLPAMLARFCAAASARAGWADVIHANWLGAGLAGAWARLAAARPMVLTLRGDDAYNVHAGGLWRVAGKLVFPSCAAVTAVSANMPPLVANLLPPRLRPVIVPTFGVDTERFRPRPGGSAAGHGPVGLFVGNIVSAKGVDVLLTALASCRGLWRRFVFVGDGPDLTRMQALGERLALGEAVQWRGRLPPAEVPAAMQSADFLVLPSLTEGRPNIVLEAMSSGLAVVATGVGGTPELIRDGQTGLLVRPGEPETLSDAIERVCRQGDLRAELGRQARRHVVESDLTWDRTAREFEAIFAGVTGSPTGPA